MLSPAQRDEFECRGILHLPATIPLAEVTAMRQRVWEHLLDAHAIHPDRPETWTVHMPAQFQRLTRTGAFDAMATGQLCAVIDDLLGAGCWQRPAHWGRPLVTFPLSGTGWDVPASGWHLDSRGESGDPAIVIFAHLAEVRPRGGGTLVVTGSHRLTAPAGPQAGSVPARSAEVKAHLRTLHPWLSDLWGTDHGDDAGRIRRCLAEGAVIHGVRVRVEELTGAPGRCRHHASRAAARAGAQRAAGSADDALAVPAPPAGSGRAARCLTRRLWARMPRRRSLRPRNARCTRLISGHVTRSGVMTAEPQSEKMTVRQLAISQRRAVRLMQTGAGRN